LLAGPARARGEESHAAQRAEVVIYAISTNDSGLIMRGIAFSSNWPENNYDPNYLNNNYFPNNDNYPQ